MYEIFEKLLMEKGLRPSDVSKATGIRTGVLSDWKRGRYQPKADKIKAIAEYLEVSPEYLTTGEKPEYYSNPESAQVAQEIFQSKDLRALFDAARDVPPEVLRSTTELLRKFKETNPNG